MYQGRFDKSSFEGGRGASGFGLGHPRGLDLKVSVPDTTDQVRGVDLTHIITVHDVAFAKGGNGGGGSGGGSGGGGTSSFAPYTSGGDASAFNIKITFTGSWTQSYYDVFVSAANTLSKLIVGDLPNVSVRSRGSTTMIDDIQINAELGTIDGLYGILGQAGPTAIRTDSSLPATATMKFDITDVNAMSLTEFADVVLHEMAHSLGFGSIWSNLGLVSNGVYTGANAVAEYKKLGGTAAGIPVEDEGGAGTAGSHWDEQIFNNELMTGYINEGENPFSRMSAASFADLGYKLAADFGGVAESYTFA